MSVTLVKNGTEGETQPEPNVNQEIRCRARICSHWQEEDSCECAMISLGPGGCCLNYFTGLPLPLEVARRLFVDIRMFMKLRIAFALKPSAQLPATSDQEWGRR